MGDLRATCPHTMGSRTSTSLVAERAVEFRTCARVRTVPGGLVTMGGCLLLSLSTYCEGHGGVRFVNVVARDLREIERNAAASEEAIIGDLDRRR